MNKKNFGNILGFTLIFALIVGLLGSLIQPEVECFDILTVKRKSAAIDKEENDSLDVLLMGDSEMCYTVSPFQLYKEHGILSYNIGSESQKLCDGVAILKHTLQNQHNVKLIVLDADTMFQKYGTVDGKDPSLGLAQKLIPLMHYHTAYKLKTLPFFITGREKERAKAETTKGFFVRYYSNAYTGKSDYMDDNPEVYKDINDGAKPYLTELLQICKNNGIALLVISSPSARNWSDGREVSVTHWCEENNIPFLNLNEHNQEIRIDWSTDTFDRGDHVNYAGSVKMNRYLGQYLVDHYDLPDHSGNAVWDEQLKASGLYQEEH